MAKRRILSGKAADTADRASMNRSVSKRTLAVALAITLCGVVAVVITAGKYKRAGAGREGQTTVMPRESAPGDLVPPALPAGDLPSGVQNEIEPTSQELDRALREEQLEVARRLLRTFPDDSNAAFLMGMAYTEQGDSDEAAAHLARSLDLDPNRPDAYDHLGRISLLRGDYEQAIRFLGKALDANPAVPNLHFRIAKALVFLGKPQEAVAQLQKEIELTPGSSESYCLLGETYHQLQDYEKAKEAYEAAVKIQPDLTKAYYGLATACTRLKQRQEARRHRAKFKQLEAEDRKAGRHWRLVFDPLEVTRHSVAHTHTDVGRVYMAKGNAKSAEQLWLRAAELDPNNVECRFPLGSYCQRTGRPAAALDIYRQIAEIQPDDGVAHYLIGSVTLQMNRPGDAERAFKKVTAVAPERPEGYVALARLYLRIKPNHPEISTLASKAVQLQPVAPNYALLARACDQCGDRAAALAAIRRAIELDPANAQYRRMDRMIREKR